MRRFAFHFQMSVGEGVACLNSLHSYLQGPIRKGLDCYGDFFPIYRGLSDRVLPVLVASIPTFIGLSGVF